MTRISRSGVSVDVPAGWEGDIAGGGFQLLADGSSEPTVLQVASFPMPAERGSFGAGAVELMRSDDIFMTLFEYGPESVGTALFDREGAPRSVAPGDFDRDALQHGIQGQSGLQYFFTERGRAFCLYIVLGSHLDRADLVPRLNAVLASLVIE